MGWPYDGNLWSDSAKPGQAQYAAIAKAISEIIYNLFVYS